MSTYQGQICLSHHFPFFFLEFIATANSQRKETLSPSSPFLQIVKNGEGPALQYSVGKLQSEPLLIPELSLERLLASFFAADAIGGCQNLGAG